MAEAILREMEKEKEMKASVPSSYINPLHHGEAPQRRLYKGAMGPSKTSTLPALLRTHEVRAIEEIQTLTILTFMLKRKLHLETSPNHIYTPVSSMWRKTNTQRPRSNTVRTQQNELHADFFHMMSGISF